MFFRNARARNAHVEATLNHPCPAQANKLRRSGGLFGAAGDYAAEEQRRAAERRGAILGACVSRARLVLAAAGTAEDARNAAAQDAARRAGKG